MSNDKSWGQADVNSSPGRASFHGKYFTQALILSVHSEGPSTPICLFVQSSPSHRDPLEPGGLDAAGFESQLGR